MNNDFPAEDGIKKLNIPTVIIHSQSDKQVPYKLGRKIFEAANNNSTKFWDIESKHIMGIYDDEAKYVSQFTSMLEK